MSFVPQRSLTHDATFPTSFLKISEQFTPHYPNAVTPTHGSLTQLLRTPHPDIISITQDAIIVTTQLNFYSETQVLVG